MMSVVMMFVFPQPYLVFLSLAFVDFVHLHPRISLLQRAIFFCSFEKESLLRVLPSTTSQEKKSRMRVGGVGVETNPGRRVCVSGSP